MNKAKIKLVALDLDGTALNSRHELSEKTIETLTRLSKKGVIVSLATGRSIRDIQKYLEILRLPQQIIPGVGYNGSYGVLFREEQNKFHKETVFEGSLPEESTKKLIEFAESLGLVMQYYNAEVGEVIAAPQNDEHKELLRKYAELTGREQLLAPNYDEALTASPSAKALILTNDADALISAAKATFSEDEFHMIRGSPSPFFVEFLRPGVTKGVGLQHICEKIGIQPEEVVAFGDGDNDKEMLEFAGIGVAMKNAKDAAKNAADIVLEWTNDDHGVAIQLDQMDAADCFA